MLNSIRILQIHKGNPLKRQDFLNGLKSSSTIQDLRISFDWEEGPIEALPELIVENKIIRKLHLTVLGYDNSTVLTDLFAQNDFLQEVHLDIHFAYFSKVEK